MQRGGGGGGAIARASAGRYNDAAVVAAARRGDKISFCILLNRTSAREREGQKTSSRVVVYVCVYERVCEKKVKRIN